MGRQEGPIEQALIHRVNALGGQCVKLTGYRGIPDRMCLLPGGAVAFVELKAPLGLLSAAQKIWQQRLWGLEFTAIVINSLEAIDKYFPMEEQDGGIYGPKGA